MLRSLSRTTSNTTKAMQSDITRNGNSAAPVFFSSMPLPPRFSSGTDSTTAVAALRPLITPAQGGKWTLTNNGEGLERSFKFKTFGKTWVRFFRLSFNFSGQLLVQNYSNIDSARTL